MQNSLPEEHPELFHYTNAVGLAGILHSQTLWATHYAYLNDSVEIRYFLENKLPEILRPLIISQVDKQIESIDDSALRIIKEKYRKYKEGIIESNVSEAVTKIKNTLLEERLSEPYITSFCTCDKNDDLVKDHGLLSQWRGYGQNGYAIVFDTFTLSELLEQLHGKNSLDLYFEKAFYSSGSLSNFKIKFDKDIEIIKNFYDDCFNENTDEDTRGLDKIYPALVKCACLYKHWGFKEENEVRIIALPQPMDNDQFGKEIATEGIDIPKIPRKHSLRSGVLVPYINLFEDIPPNSGKRLPIRRIIVGPTANAEESKRRVRAVKILLDQYAIEEVDVTPSDIPYIG